MPVLVDLIVVTTHSYPVALIQLCFNVYSPRPKVLGSCSYVSSPFPRDVAYQ